MVEAERVALVLLAAGRSRRFDGDKLSEPFLDKPIAFHVMTAIEHIPFRTRIAVVANTSLDFAAWGYSVVENMDSHLGQARSLAIGIERALAIGCDYILVAMADMPRVTGAHILRILDGAYGPETIVASSDGVRPMAPVLFGKNRLEALRAVDSAQSAAELIKAGRHVIAAPTELVDIDTREDLEALRARYRLRSDGKRRSPSR